MDILYQDRTLNGYGPSFYFKSSHMGKRINSPRHAAYNGNTAFSKLSDIFFAISSP